MLIEHRPWTHDEIQKLYDYLVKTQEPLFPHRLERGLPEREALSIMGLIDLTRKLLLSLGAKSQSEQR